MLAFQSEGRVGETYSRGSNSSRVAMQASLHNSTLVLTTCTRSAENIERSRDHADVRVDEIAVALLLGSKLVRVVDSAREIGATGHVGVDVRA